jgi:rhodanese-related sulfurtransferase
MLGNKLSAPTQASWTDVTPNDLHRRLGAAPRPRVVDVREPDELAGELGHIEGIEHVPLAELPAACATWSRDDEIVVLCRSSGRSGKAAAHLAAQGFTRVHNLIGGMQAWNAAALPVVRRGGRR